MSKTADQEGLSRRAVLRALVPAAITGGCNPRSSAAPGAKVVTWEVDAPAPGRKTACPAVSRVIVIGAGMAGLTTANALGAAGVRCVVLEARRRVGGRIRTVDVAGAAVGYVDGAFSSGLREARRLLGRSQVTLRLLA